MDSLREFDSSVVILRSRATKNPYSCFFTIPAFQACGPQPWPAQARKRAPQAAPESQALCHSERSEESFPLRTKGRVRTMPRKEEKDKRSAVKNLFGERLQILRRSAPQNDKLLNCSQTPQQTGICNWRQRGKVERKRCSGRPRLAELNTGFSRASRSPALRRLAGTRPAGFGTRTTQRRPKQSLRT